LAAFFSFFSTTALAVAAGGADLDALAIFNRCVNVFC
jgi:hypothetical protein